MKYETTAKETTITYEMVEEDWRGKPITPYLGVSINGSPFVSAKDIIQRSLEISDITLKSLADREAM